jgi:hypothetical protein
MSEFINLPRQTYIRGVAAHLAETGRVHFLSEEHYKYACAAADRHWRAPGALDARTQGDVLELANLLKQASEQQLRAYESTGKVASAVAPFYPTDERQVADDLLTAIWTEYQAKMAGEVTRNMDVAAPMLSGLEGPSPLMEDELRRRPDGFENSPIGGTGLGHVPEHARQGTNVPVPGATGPMAQGPSNTLIESTKMSFPYLQAWAKSAGDVARNMDVSGPQLGGLDGHSPLMEDEVRRRPAGFENSPVGGTGLGHVPAHARKGTNVPVPGATGPAAQGPSNTLVESTKTSAQRFPYLAQITR